MKFSDIKSFTQCSEYHVNVALNRFKEYIGHLIEEYDLQLNPDFQRGHVWSEADQIRFVEYFLRGGLNGTSLYFNNPIWDSFKETKGYDDMVLVDGLQRTTALIRFLDNEIPVFGDTYYKDFEGNFSITRNNIDIYINSLKTKKEVLTWYIEMNEGGVVHTDEEIQKVKDLLKALD